jgi:ribosomal protein S24E
MGEMMNVKILTQKRNDLLGREEIEAICEHEGKPTPKREEIIPHLQNLLKKDASLILIRKIFTQKGRGASRLKIFVYDKKEDMPKRVVEIIEARMKKKKGEEKTEEKKG